MDKVLKKWNFLIDSLGVIDKEKKIKIAKYIEHYIQLSNLRSTHMDESFNVRSNLLPINVKVMSELNNFEITNDPSKVENITYSVLIKQEDWNENFDDNGVYHQSNIEKLESVLLYQMIEKLKDKDILIYSLVDSLSIISEKDFGAKMIINSRIKIT